MQKKKEKINNKTQIIVIVILSLLLCVSLGDTLYITTSHKLEIKPYRPVYLNYKTDLEFTKEQVRELVVGLYKVPHLYFENKINGDGLALIKVGIVIVNPDVDDFMYGYVLAHELTHLKYRVGNESWVSFEAFKTLYESGNEILRSSAMYYASKVMDGYYCGEYDIGYYILEYLEERNAL